MNFKILLASILILFFSESYSQKIKGSWYLSASPMIGSNFNTYRNNPGNAYKDSVKKMDRFRSSVGANILFGLELQNKSKLMFGLQFHDFGFTRKREDYNFLDTLHPEIGIMTDLSQTGGNYISFNYRYRYLTLPVLYSTQISGRSIKNSTVHWVIGGSVSALIKHDIKAVLRGFTTKGENVFILKDAMEDPSRININFQTGFRLETLLYGKNSFIFVQPGLYIPIFSANNGKEKHHLYSLTCEIGLILKPHKERLEQ